MILALADSSRLIATTAHWNPVGFSLSAGATSHRAIVCLLHTVYTVFNAVLDTVHTVFDVLLHTVHTVFDAMLDTVYS